MNKIENSALFKLSYGLFVLTAKTEKDNGCIINTAMQIADNPKRISIAVNKSNYTCSMIEKTGEFNVSVISEKADFSLFKHFGFQSGKDTDKFSSFNKCERSENGIFYITENTNAYMSAKVTEKIDCDSHILFIAEVTEAKILSDVPSATYQYYFDHIKPKPEENKKKGFVCKICGYVYEGETLPDDYICPICKHPASDFEPL